MLNDLTEHNIKVALNKLGDRYNMAVVASESWKNLNNHEEHIQAAAKEKALLDSWRLLATAITGKDCSNEDLDVILTSALNLEENGQ